MTECGPVLLWSVVPIEVVMAGAGGYPPRLQEAVVDGRLVLVLPGPDGLGTVMRLISGQARDYLDPRFQPGARVPLRPG